MMLSEVCGNSAESGYEAHRSVRQLGPSQAMRLSEVCGNSAESGYEAHRSVPQLGPSQAMRPSEARTNKKQFEAKVAKK